MTDSQYIIGKRCAKMGCGGIAPSDSASCTRCGGEQKSFYDYYSLFEIEPGFSDSDLTKAYKKQSLKYHPDINEAGNDMFIVVSEGYQILKDTAKRSEYDQIRQRILSGDFTSRQVFGQQYASQGQYGFYQHNFTQEDFENIFRQFHGFARPDSKVQRASAISGRLGAILGGAVSMLLFMASPMFYMLLLPGIFFGYIFGKFNPGLAPLLLKVTNLLIGFFGVGFMVRSVMMGSFPMVFLAALGMYYYFKASRRWSFTLSSL
jgi:hypothetical protein